MLLSALLFLCFHFQAAVNIGGSTIHSFAGVGIADKPISDLIKIASHSSNTKKRWRTCQVLVVDEVSMLSADYFDIVNAIAKAIRKSDKPFGGIQVVLCGVT